jgi:pimeloyl-ACP methyl ester carboxylesterase
VVVAAVIPRLARDHRLIVPDLRGWGWSDAPPGRYEKATYAADTIAPLDAMGIERAGVIGHDWGGYTTFLLALAHPDRTTRAMALDIPPAWLQRPATHPRYAVLPLVLSYQVAIGMPVSGPRLVAHGRLVRMLIRGGSGPAMRWTGAELDADVQPLRDPARARASSACYRTFVTRELPAAIRHGPRRGDLAVPMLLAMGGRGPFQRVLRIDPEPRLRVETIPGAGHFLPEEAPGSVADLALWWFGGG